MHLADVHARRHAQRVQDDVHRGAVLHEGHVLFRHDLGDDTLVAVAAGQLVALGDLALLGHVDPHQAVDTRGQVVAVSRENSLTPMTTPRLAVGHLEGRVAHLARLLLEDGPDQLLFRGQFGLALGGDLAHQQVAGAHLGADAHDAVLVEVGQRLLAAVGDVPGDLFVTQLGGAGLDLVLLDVHRGQDVVLDHALADDDGVLEVVALPAHERHQQVAAQRQLPRCWWRRRRPGLSPGTTVWPRSTIGFWWMKVPWLERPNLSRSYVSRSPSSVSTRMRSAETPRTRPGCRASTTSPVSTAERYSMPVPIRGASP